MGLFDIFKPFVPSIPFFGPILDPIIDRIGGGGGGRAGTGGAGPGGPTAGFCHPGDVVRHRAGADTDCVSTVTGIPYGPNRNFNEPPPGRQITAGGNGGCTSPAVLVDGQCVDRSQGAIAAGGGAVVMGRYGPAMVPMSSARGLKCLAGMVLGKDELCYNSHGDNKISNRNRKWPRGRAPLLTGGEMNCITTASRVTGKIETKVKQLQKMGMMSKPKSAPRAKKKAPLQLQPGVSVVNVE